MTRRRTPFAEQVAELAAARVIKALKDCGIVPAASMPSRSGKGEAWPDADKGKESLDRIATERVGESSTSMDWAREHISRSKRKKKRSTG